MFELATETRPKMDHVNLPKWPQMLVKGRSVTPAQAADIIVRTDYFWRAEGHGGNNHEFDKALCTAVGVVRTDYTNASIDWNSVYAEWDTFRNSINYVTTEYVHTSWISCAFIAGPHGWCQPDGQLFYTDNVGKWPSADEVYDDWCKIAAAWPFLDLEVALMSGESCEDSTQVLVVFSISKGVVTAHGADYPVFARFDASVDMVTAPVDFETLVHRRLSGDHSENHYTVAQVVSMVDAVKN